MQAPPAVGSPALLGAPVRLFYRLILRPLLRHPLLAALNILSIALGVAVFSAVQSANRSANEAFRSSVRLVSGSADLEVHGRIPETLLPLVAAQPGIASVEPAVEWIGTLPSEPGEYVRVLGIDPFGDADLRPFVLTAADGSAPDLEVWLRDPAAAAVFAGGPLGSAGTDAVAVDGPGGRVSLVPRFAIRTVERGADFDRRLVAMDIAWAQETAGMQGFLTSILLRLDDGVDVAEVAGELAALLPGNLQIQTPSGRNAQTEGMLASFQLNLVALSLVSILVGCFLIYNTVSASVLRRRTEIGILRAMGAGPGFLRGLFLIEAAAAGLAGALCGLALSMPLAAGLSGLVERTISSLYVLLSIERVVLTLPQVLLGLAVGLGAALAAAWMPASEAVRVDPREVLHPGFKVDRALRCPNKTLPGGLVLLAVAVLSGWASLALRIGWVGFLSAFCVLAGFSLCVPAGARLTVGWVVRRLPARAATASIALRNLARSLFRNSVTMAALAAAVAMLVSISVMIFSFRGSVERWMEQALVADLFVAPAANQISGIRHEIDPELVAWVRDHPATAAVAAYLEVPIQFGGRAANLGVFSGRSRGDLEFIEGDSSKRAAKLETPGWVAVSESFAARFSIRAGDRITLPLSHGPIEFEVAGTFRDYTRDAGTVLLERENYLRHGGSDRVQSLAVYLRDPAELSCFAKQIRGQGANGSPLAVLGNRELRERIGEIFDETFAITGVLRLIAIVVAVTGVLLGLGILVNERSREIAVFRAIGASRAQVMRTVLIEGGAIGLLASLIGLVSGAALAVVLTFVINKAYFGWTVDLAFPAGFLLWVPVWVVATALIAAVWPAWRAASISPAEALRYE